MLLELRIADLAIIEDAEIHGGPGFNVLTGETGAGKSIVIDALGLLIGDRAASEQVGPKGRARVEGRFDLTDAPIALRFLRDQDIEADGLELVVTREISADGRNRVRLNGRLATAAALRELGSHLIDLHGQHEHQLLLRPEAHGGFLDAFGPASHAALQGETRAKYLEWRAAQKRLDALTRDEQGRVQRLDMLQFQLSEIDGIAPQIGEDTQLQDERARLLNAEKLRDAAAQCRDALSGGEEAGALTMLGVALQAGREIEAVDGSVANWIAELQGAIYEIQDAAAEAAAYAETLEADPLRLEEIEVRLQRLNRLKRKYGDSIERVLAHREEIALELNGLSLSEEELGSLRDSVRAQQSTFLQAAERLSASRRELGERFSSQVVAHLHTLAMERARFEVHFERDENGSAEGIDRIEFLLSANPGQPPRPLARIASGGEISRVMLALRSVLGDRIEETPAQSTLDGALNGADGESGAGRVPILIFDEVDVGIGGVTAEAVGEKMQELARRFQVFCVTHLPQIARRADRHYSVRKESDAHATRVQVQLLDSEQRVRELARMMGRESEANLRHARELLGEAGHNGAPAKPAAKKSAVKKGNASAT